WRRSPPAAPTGRRYRPWWPARCAAGRMPGCPPWPRASGPWRSALPLRVFREQERAFYACRRAGRLRSARRLPGRAEHQAIAPARFARQVELGATRTRQAHDGLARGIDDHQRAVAFVDEPGMHVSGQVELLHAGLVDFKRMASQYRRLLQFDRAHRAALRVLPQRPGTRQAGDGWIGLVGDAIVRGPIHGSLLVRDLD